MLKETYRMTGTVKWYDEKKGFGFIKPDMNGEDVFLHRTSLQPHEDTQIVTGDRITFTIQKQERGPAALEVERFEEEYEVLQFDQVEEENELLQSDQVGIGKNFTDLDLNPEILRAIRDVGYVDPTPIQALAIPIVLKGQDLLGCAQTGTGKTAAFALPIMQRLGKINKQNLRQIRVLVLSPTRELAIQIGDSFSIYGKYTGLKNAVIYGGVGQNPQVKKLQSGVDIVVATPGRLLDLMRQGYINLSHVKMFVLDEGDRMLDMGFIHDIRSIVKMMPQKNRQSLLFSATIPREIKEFAKTILHNPVEINISPNQPTLEIIKQAAYFISKEKKQALLEYLLADATITRALVFTRTKHGADKVVKKLRRKGIYSEPIHGNKSQTARQNALENFRTGKTRVLVATDVASRGIDVDDISHVIQFDLPDMPETYVHRIGRTARAGAGGTALAFCEKSQRKQLKEIERLIRMQVNIVQNHPYIF